MNKKIIVSELTQINLEAGDVYHGLKNGDNGFLKFGELYFSKINFNKIKAWKKHKSITLNLIVPYGEVKFVFLNDDGSFSEYIIGDKNYKRLTIPPNIWFGFKGIKDPFSLISSVIDSKHDPLEVDKEEINYFKDQW